MAFPREIPNHSPIVISITLNVQWNSVVLCTPAGCIRNGILPGLKCLIYIQWNPSSCLIFRANKYNWQYYCTRARNTNTYKTTSLQKISFVLRWLNQRGIQSSEQILHGWLFFFYNPNNICLFSKCKTEQKKKKKKRKPGILTTAAPGAMCPSTTALHRPWRKINWQDRKTRNSNVGSRKQSHHSSQSRTETYSQFCAGQLYPSGAD